MRVYSLPINDMDYIHDPWYRAIHNCTACLRDQNAEGADMCLAYLNQLEEELSPAAAGAENNSVIMNDLDDAWNRIPENLPSDWDRFVQENNHNNNDPSNNMMVMLHGALHQPDSYGFIAGSHQRLNSRRILARILTSQSEVFAMKATYSVRVQKDWILAISSYQNAIYKIHRGLDVTDTAICQWWGQMELIEDIAMSNSKKKERTLLEDDASIIIVALESITDRHNKLLADGKREESRLVRTLQPQWETRDVAKERFGERRWTNNPRPKNDHALERKESEKRLRVVRKALESLQALDPQKILQKANDLQQQLVDGQPPPQNDNNNNNNNSERRYNSMRPSPEYLQQHVSMEEYPTPEEFGWMFTGSWREVEFYEQIFPNIGLVKLDWYFTTATVKTSLDHTIQGKTQLFAKQCDPSEYLEVLLNPRSHTGKRYHRKPRSNRS